MATHCFANVGREAIRVCQPWEYFRRCWPRLAPIWPTSARIHRIWAETRLPGQLFGKKRSRSKRASSSARVAVPFREVAMTTQVDLAHPSFGRHRPQDGRNHAFSWSTPSQSRTSASTTRAASRTPPPQKGRRRLEGTAGDSLLGSVELIHAFGRGQQRAGAPCCAHAILEPGVAHRQCALARACGPPRSHPLVRRRAGPLDSVPMRPLQPPGGTSKRPAQRPRPLARAPWEAVARDSRKCPGTPSPAARRSRCLRRARAPRPASPAREGCVGGAAISRMTLGLVRGQPEV